jgi:Escherichia/Staphylococcus phage prohead protease
MSGFATTEQLDALGVGEVEKRAYSCEVRAADSAGKLELVGYAALFGVEARIFDFIEIIERGAFARTLKEGDARAFWNHNPDIVLGRVKNGTLQLSQDLLGLRVSITPPDTALIRDQVIAPIERGDVSQMSFGFRVPPGGDRWERMADGTPRRVITEVELFEVSPVAMPAYSQTSISVSKRAQWQAAAAREKETVMSDLSSRSIAELRRQLRANYVV